MLKDAFAWNFVFVVSAVENVSGCAKTSNRLTSFLNIFAQTTVILLSNDIKHRV